MHHPRNQPGTGAQTSVPTEVQKPYKYFCINICEELIGNYFRVQMPKNEIVVIVHVWGL